MARLIRYALGLLALAAPAAAFAGSANLLLRASGTPPGFAELAGEREVLVDVYFGGRKVGEALAVAAPGHLRFRDGGAVAAMVPDIVAPAEVASALREALPTHSDRICLQGNAADCGTVAPDVAAIIYDEDRFRADLFVNSRLLRPAGLAGDAYLPVPDAPLGLTSAMGAAIAGSTSGPTTYNLQNRTIVGYRNARVRINSSLASGLGLVVDDVVGELDQKDLRYSAGMFWAPGNEFVGQRRIIGGGIATQFDTSDDRESLHATPMVLFLAQPARVELLVDGRLTGSGAYAAGNVAVDTSALPEGSYNVLLRIRPANGPVREERRFFVKNAKAPPIGHPVIHAFAGVLANTRRHQPLSLSDNFYFQAGAAWRLGPVLALDASALGTQHKAMLQLGAWVIRPRARMRVAALASTTGDAGALLQLTSGGQGPLNFSFDLRRIWSSDGKPLIPLPSYVDSFRSAPPTGVQLASGSYTQATGSLGLRVGSGYVALVASYRKDRRLPADYSIGPSINWPLITRGGVQLLLDASAQRTRTTTSAFVGARLLFTSGGFSMLGSLGHASQNERGASSTSQSRLVGNVTAQYAHEDRNRTLLELQTGIDRSISATTARAGASLYSRFGNARADVLHNFEGSGGSQFGVTLQSGLALSGTAATVGGRDLEPSAILVSVDGDARDAEFDVLVDDAVRGHVRAGERLSLFVPGYRTYQVRLVPSKSLAVSFDAAAREVTLYPGNVRALVWTAQRYFTMFAQAMAPDGRPIANALVATARSVAQTDASGYFQLDVALNDPITIARKGGSSCHLNAPTIAPKGDLASLGKVLCK
jgi:hypothetical protein